MILKKTLYSTLILGLASTLLLTGCRDDDLYLNGEDSLEIKEPSLVFDFNLAPYDNGDSGHSHVMLDHGEEWENYIDPSKLRVLFCDLEGNYLFEVDRKHITVHSKSHVWGGTSDVYRVTISQRDLYPVDRPEEHNDAVKKALEEDGFKVAVLANWPTFVEDFRDIDPNTGDELLGPADISTNLDFVWDPTHKDPRSHIEYLSHCIFDNVYGVISKDDTASGVGTLPDSYSHIALYDPSLDMSKGGRMGVYSSWVSYLYTSQNDAADFIRKGQDEYDAVEGNVRFTYSYSGSGDNFTCTPFSYTRYVDASNEYSLENIWRLWNFSAGKTCGYHHANSDKVNDYWTARNENTLIHELDKLQTSWPSNFEVKDKSGETLIQSNNANSRYYPVVAGQDESGFMRISNHANMTTANFQKIITSVSNNSSLVSDFENSAIMFKAYGEGTLRIRAKGAPNSRIAVLTKVPESMNSEKVQYVTMLDEFGRSYTSTDPFFDPLDRGEVFVEREEYGQGAEYIIDPSSKQYVEVYIGAIDADVDIYEIEYMRARHVYDAARNAIMPSAANPIPMYGMQNFDPIGEFLKPSQTFNMSDGNENKYLADYPEITRNYNYKTIFLIRSLAKVELRFAKSVFKNNPPEHVMMRVMNRTARCEPKDVINPTDWIWYGDGGFNPYTGAPTWIDAKANPETFVGVANEFNNIKKYFLSNPLHDKTANDSDKRLYKERTSWFYGIWAATDNSLTSADHNRYYWSTPWEWNGDKSFSVPNDLPYPRIFNTRIDRSDYCRFHCVPERDGYIRYIMYVPEKNISDTDSKGNLTATPKVQHMEVRFKGMNDVMNFDDNNCYRIYFTDYAENGKVLRDINRDGTGNYDDAERNDDNATLLNYLQPVMRNCHYIFTINSINNEKLGVNFSVCGAAKRESFNGGFVIN